MVRRRRRWPVVAVASAGLAFGSVTLAHADPSSAPTPTPAPTAAASASTQAPGQAAAATSPAESSAATSSTGGDVLDQLAEQYMVGAGGGQLSNLLKVSLKLRAMGFKPSKANLAEITQAMGYRPNQMPLIAALKDTIAYQQKIRAQMEILQQYQQQQANSAVLGGAQMAPGAGTPGMSVGTAQPGTGMVPPEAAAPMMPAAPPATP